MIQSGHAIYKMVKLFRPEAETPNHILIGVPNVAALRRVEAKLQLHQIPHYSWTEPDNDMGFTAIATIPLTAIEKEVLSNYRLLQHRCSPVVSTNSTLASKAKGASESLAG